MNGKSKLTRQQHQHDQHQEIGSRQEQQAAGREFTTVEEMLRFDASQTPVPETVAQRLQDSVEHENLQPARSWWKRLFRK